MKIKVKPISSGKAKGKIIFFKPNILTKRFNNRIVVVSSLDVPSVIKMIRGSKGIISEEGGLTSHAASLVREFNLPCLILSNAKKILKPGSVIHLDCENFSISGDIKKIGPKKRYRYIKKNGWILIRPYQRPKFQEDLVIQGIKITPKILFNKQELGLYKTTPRGYWVKNIPSPSKIAQKIINDNRWFYKKIYSRRKLYCESLLQIKKIEKQIKSRDLTLSSLIDIIRQLKKICINRRPYIFLTQYPIDYLDEYFYNLVISFLSIEEANELFKSILQQKYSLTISKNSPNFLISKQFPAIWRKNILLPPPKIKFIDLEPNYLPIIKLSRSIKRKIKKLPQNKKNLFESYLKILPLLVQLNDETTYTEETIKIIWSHLLQRISKYLKKYKIITKVEDLLNFDANEIIVKAELINKNLVKI